MLVRLLSFVTVVPVLLLYAEPRTAAIEVRTPVLLHRYQLVHGGKFSVRDIKARSVADLKAIHAEQRSSELRLIRISYFSDLNDLKRTISGKGTDRVTFDYWKMLFEKHGSPVLPTADVIELNGDAVLRYRSDETLVTEPLTVPTSGKPRNPLLLTTHGVTFELLELLPDADGKSGLLRCYAKFAPLPDTKVDNHLAGVLAVNLADKLHIKNVVVYLRRDSWFILEPDFPITYRFETSTPPSKEEFESSQTFVESAESGRHDYHEYHKVK